MSAGRGFEDSRRRVRARVAGTVQGVGFRPYVYRLASALGLGGFVRNDGRGVVLEVEGAPESVDQFLARLPAEAPPLAAIEGAEVDEITATGEIAFGIVESARRDGVDARIAPDTATCAECLTELFDPANRRFRYPFINCTNCGPRFTIVRGVPYDRALTTMAGFVMCERCRAEYDDPHDRRFHAEPNACPVCGPRVRLTDGTGASVSLGAARDPVVAAARALHDGAIVAVKGLGGYHLACRADDAEAVAGLRARKCREEKPFALMPPDLPTARRLVTLDDVEERILTGRERPIVLARRRADAPVVEAVAPGCRELGVMLPYTPLHHLLLADLGATLVMTSGNHTDEPIAFQDDDALQRLASIADLFLVHDRPIETRTDDSVVRVATIDGSRRPLMLRRSRGYVPTAIPLPTSGAPSVLGVGAQLKNTFCLTSGNRAVVGHHIGDLENLETLRSFAEGVAHIARLLELSPAIVAHDLHPDYLSTSYALEHAACDAIGVQHHHAHLAACLAEHGERGAAIGAIFDGTGYAPDGTIWGGELLLGDLADAERIGHLWPVRMPGGEAAIREPWRMACAWLLEATGVAVPPRSLCDRVDPRQWERVARLAHTGLASPFTTSMGRLCDALAALCGLRMRVSYEGQAAIELEMIADDRIDEGYPMPVIDRDRGRVLDARELVRAAASDLDAGRPVGEVAACVHHGVARATAAWCLDAVARSGVETVVLSGGVFQNVRLLEETAQLVVRGGARVLIPERLPPNDGGISYGQAVVAAARTARSRHGTGAPAIGGQVSPPAADLQRER